MKLQAKNLEKPGKIKVRLCFKEDVDDEAEDALFKEVFKILGIFDNPIINNEMKKQIIN